MISRSFLQTAAVVAVGNGAVALLGIVALRVYTELAPADVYGAANLILAALALGFQLLVHPVVATQLRYHTEAAQAGGGEELTRQSLHWALAASAAQAVLAAVGLAVWQVWGHGSVGAPLVLAVAASILVAAPRYVFLARLHAEQHMRAYMAMRVIEAALTVLATASALWLATRTEAFLWGQIVAILGVLLGIWMVAPWPTWQHLVPSGSEPPAASDFRDRLVGYGAPFVPMALLYWVANLADRYVLAGMLGTAAAGQYFAAFAIASSAFSIAIGTMGDLFRPKLFDAENAGEPDRAQRIFLAWLGTYAGISLCGLLAIWLLGPWIVALILAKSYRDGAVTIMLWVALGYAFNGFAVACENRMLSLGRSGRLLWPLAAGAAANVALSFLLVSWYGIVGAAKANCLSFGLQLLLTALFLYRLLQQRNRRAAPAV